MPYKTTKAQQQTAVGEGLALGAIMLDIESINGNKTSLELDFRRAWRAWSHRDTFPAVHAGPVYDDVFHILHRSTRRRSPKPTYWEGSWPFVAVLRFDDWTADEIADVIDDRVPAAAWEALVRAWLAPEATHATD